MLEGRNFYSFAHLIPRKVLKVCLVLLALLSAAPAFAETFVLDGNKALNTNPNFRLIDGHPRMSTWDHSLNDADQNFDRKTGGNGGEHLVHRRTGKCVNAYRRWNGAEVNVYPCRLGDGDQNFNIESIGNGDVQIRVANTNFCLDNPNRINGGLVTLQQCVRNANQRFKINGGTVVVPPVTIGQPNFASAFYRQSNPFWLAGYAPASTNPPNPKLGASKGNCTWYASGRAKDFGRNASNVNKLLGHASEWAAQARNAGLTTSNTPVAGAIAQWGAGNVSNQNHVAVVEKVNGDGTIVISESSFASPGSTYDYLYRTRTISANNPSIYILP